jgi:hypothetical protein
MDTTAKRPTFHGVAMTNSPEARRCEGRLFTNGWIEMIRSALGSKASAFQSSAAEMASAGGYIGPARIRCRVGE